ncbi:MAG: ATP-dependent DNA helicase [Lachnospiraceae bacterium]|nr:ATP-dependent DNA helicase [Lachnospiraceae bacterium]
MDQKGKKVIKISVRSLVEFVLRSGNIDNRRTSGAEKDAMQAGNRIHRKIQRRMGADYHAEVSLKYATEREQYQILVEGRADGVIKRPGETIIDEIKGVYMDLGQMDKPVDVHLAQAFCYGYMYAYHHSLEKIGIQLTYCNIETEEIRRFKEEKTLAQLRDWFENLIREYEKWAEYLYCHEISRNDTLKMLEFPYVYREGQKELVVAVYRALSRGRNLFIQAPTGIGKTLSTVYPALKSMGEGRGDKLFYLTAKTITRSVAEECFGLLKERGLYFSTVTITAKEKLCPMDRTECNPDACSLARGHFDRVNEAVFDIIHKESMITRELVLKYSTHYQVCPFEFCLDISNWVDGIICDYNYVFDPEAKLKRYFSEGVSGEYLFLIDEAHNLVHRAREMFSAVLVKEDFLTVKRILKGRAAKVERGLERCNKKLLEMKREGGELGEGKVKSVFGIRQGEYRILEDANLFVDHLMGMFGELERFMEEPEGERDFPDRDTVLDFYFQVRHFLNMYEGLDDHYRVYTEVEAEGKFSLHLFCIDPSRCLAECLDKGVGSVFFSATLLPVLYYKKLLSGNTEDYAVYAASPFPRKNRMLLIGRDVSSRYTRRNQGEYRKVVDYIFQVTKSHRGNYMVFFPSYQFMKEVEKELCEQYDGSFTWRMQEGGMTEPERESFLKDFEAGRDKSFVGLCVLGGIFSEGIDLKAERLEGVIIVGIGIPMVCTEQEILKEYFDDHMENGYDYAYQYPGMNKVMQAAGRVIRTSEDRGIILLLDDRFLRPEVQGMFPREWSEYAPVTRNTVAGWLKRFWDG